MSKYSFLKRRNGSFRILPSSGNLENAFYVPPVTRIREIAQAELEMQGYYPHRTRKVIACYSIIKGDGRSYKRGLELLKLKDARKPQGTKIPLSKIQEAIISFWSEDIAQAIVQGQEPEKGMKDFRESHGNFCYSAYANYGGLRALMESMPYPYKELYSHVHKPILKGSVSETEVKKRLLEAHSSGFQISPSGLRESSDRDMIKLIHQVEYLVRRSQDKTSPLLKIIELTGLPKKEIMGTAIATLGERFVELFLNLTLLRDFKLPGFNISGIVERERERNRIRYNGDTYADLRIGNHAVEVKTLGAPFPSSNALEMSKKYAPCINLWADGQMIEGSSVFFNAKEEHYKPVCKPMQEAGINVFGFGVVNESLREFLDFMEKDHSDKLKAMTPRVHSPADSLSSFYRILCFNQQQLKGTGNAELRRYAFDYIEGLIKLVGEINDNR